MAKSAKNQKKKAEEYSEVAEGRSSGEIMLLVSGAVLVFLFLCNFGICGALGNALRFFMFGVFGLGAYILPPLIFLACAFLYANRASRAAKIKTGAGAALYIMINMIAELAIGRIQAMERYSLPDIYMESGTNRNGGGVIAGSLAYACYKNLSMAGTVLLLIVGFIICGVLLTERSFIKGLKRGGRFVAEETAHTVRGMRERERIRRKADRKRRELLEEKKQLAIEQREDEKLLRRERKLSGVTTDTMIEREEDDRAKGLATRTDAFIPGEDIRDDVHEITVHRYGADDTEPAETARGAAGESTKKSDDDIYKKRGNVREITRESFADYDERGDYESYDDGELDEPEDINGPDSAGYEPEPEEDYIPRQPEPSFTHIEKNLQEVIKEEKPSPRKRPVAREVKRPEPEKIRRPYEFPPIELLKKGSGADGDTDEELRDTADKLVKILATFGVNARVTEVSQGPTVTRYELQPEAGVKVSKILGLTDDIKLNLAATDIRIEAPIPGKAAVGIEVPNKAVATVFFRDVVDTQDFKAFKSKLAFGVGKDLAGKPVVADIAKMPHVLIAGATGSGKSVCINTIIMSILYKASPDEVKLIMIDPKVVELSVYNGIPHLLIPVVTEPQKAAAALNWAVAEMTRRYKLFADAKVRDLAGYNAAIEKMEEGERPPKMSQILVIVDELADLMMTCANDVESAIVRLTQLARAAGIHLVIATQRPSVDVITGLIKANMPSRVAFAVTSNTDSRTILDMVGAERLLGKGDMLFFPQGYTRPARVQGAFVSDEEVAEVTKFIRDQEYIPVAGGSIDEEMESIEAASGAAGGQVSDGGNDRDAFFEDAARLVIGKDKASISMLQRVFKVGFNRSARIMDQLCEAGVVSEDEGTKPRKVLMTEVEFDAYMEGDAGDGEEPDTVSDRILVGYGIGSERI